MSGSRTIPEQEHSEMGHRTSHQTARTPADLIEAATIGARISARASAARGGDEETTRRAVIGRLRKEIEAESFGFFADEGLMAAAQAAVDSVLEELRSRAGTTDATTWSDRSERGGRRDPWRLPPTMS
jgi:hypothetical protein